MHQVQITLTILMAIKNRLCFRYLFVFCIKSPSVCRTQTHLCVTGLALASHARTRRRPAGSATALRPSSTADGAGWPRWPVEPRTGVYRSHHTDREYRDSAHSVCERWHRSHWLTCAAVSVTGFLLSAGSHTLSASALRGGVITLTRPDLSPASTLGRAFRPGSPLAPAAVDMATRNWITLQDTCFTGAGKKGSKNIQTQR